MLCDPTAPLPTQPPQGVHPMDCSGDTGVGATNVGSIGATKMGGLDPSVISDQGTKELSLDPAVITEGIVQQLRAVAKRFVLCRRAEQVRVRVCQEDVCTLPFLWRKSDLSEPCVTLS